jgi:hypothetical protein
VKATLHRSTLHLVSASDYLGSVAALTSVLRTKWMNEARGLPVNRSLAELAQEALDFAARPRSNAEMREFAGTLGEPVRADGLWRRIRRYASFIAVPGAEPWSYGRRPVHIAARAWLDRQPVPEDESLERVVRSHLAAFGPARLVDISQWSSLAVSRLRRGLERIDALERHDDDDGHELFDLPGAPLPRPDVPAPPRLLPMWDETLLAYKDRSRMLPQAYRKRVIVKAGDVLPTVTVDGYVAGLWWAELDDGAARPRIALEPFGSLAAGERDVLEAEADALAEFLVGREPSVYARYRLTGRRP